MRPMRILHVCALFVGVTLIADPGRAEVPVRVLGPRVDGVAPERMVGEYLRDRARQQLAARHQSVVALATRDALTARQREVRETVLRSIGGLPERTPLNARVVGRLDRDGYRVEKVIYESRPGFAVTAALYIPEPARGTAGQRYPAVLVACGHSEVGKAEEAYQRVCLALVKNGFVVLCYDPISQGERNQILDVDARPVLSGSTTEHTVIGIQCLLLGTHVAGYRIWDGIRSIDYLLSRPEVDPSAIGVTGNSGGGTMTAYLVATDERIACAAPSCYITSYERLFATIGPQDGEQNLTRAVVDGLDHADFLEVFAPKPILVCSATRDFFDIQGTWATFREAKRFYTAMGVPERINLVEANDSHGFTPPRGIAVLRWMRRWLQNEHDPVGDPPMRIESPEALRCTDRGEVLLQTGARSTFDLNRRVEQRLITVRARRFRTMSPAPWLVEVERLAVITPPSASPSVHVVDRGRHGDMRVERLELRPERGIALPALFCEPPAGRGDASTVVYVNSDGKTARFDDVAALVRAGHRVLAVDVRGWGETQVAGNEERGLSRYASKEWKNAFLALYTGKTLLGMRTEDVISAVAYAEQRAGTDAHIVVIGVGRAGPVVLHAAAFDPRIRQVITDGGLVSWSSALTEPLARGVFPSLVPGALRHYDLPLLIERIAPRPVVLVNPIGARQQSLDADQARGEFSRAFEGAGSGSARFVVTTDAARGDFYADLLARNNRK